MSDDLDATSFHLGQLTGQMKEVVHTLKDVTMKLELIGREVIRSSELPKEVSELKAAIAKFEAKENQRTGAVNLGAWLLKTPLVGWVVGTALAAWALWKGQGQ